MLSSALYLYRHFIKPLETQLTTPHIDFLSLESERSFRLRRVQYVHQSTYLGLFSDNYRGELFNGLVKLFGSLSEDL